MLDGFKLRGFEEEEALKILNDNFGKLNNEFHCDSLDDLYISVSTRNPTPSAVLEVLRIKKKLVPKLGKKKPAPPKEASSTCPVEVPGGITGLAVTLGQCCTPIPGDAIVGYITRGKGITVHRCNCPNVAHEKARLIDLKWKEDLGVGHYPVDLEIFANDRSNLVADILQAISAKGIVTSDLRSHLVTETMNCVINVTISVTDSKCLDDLFAVLLGVKGVFSVSRVIH